MKQFPQSQATKRIWLAGTVQKNSYGEFIGLFDTDGESGVFLQIACDSCYAAWLNGVLVAFSACGDYPWYKLYDSVDLTASCRQHNELRIQVWYFGENSQTYLVGHPGTAFEVVQEQQVLLYSSKSIQSRKIANYRNGDTKIITQQLGFSFCYDNSIFAEHVYKESDEYPLWNKLILRKTGALALCARADAEVKETPDGYLVDLGKETVGFLELDIESPEKQHLQICYGEHLTNGQVPRIIGTRDFSVEFIAAEGENRYINPFRRLAGRYLHVICRKPIIINYLGLRPVELPLIEKKTLFADALDQRIYDVSVNTLKQCMHEHYEDSPWREQAMYAMDSRNQMLCGYQVFEGTVYQREMILLMAQGQRPDGLLSLCFPGGMDYPIPFFSLVYLKILEEYVTCTSDESILKIVEPKVCHLMEAFENRVERNGLIANFPYPYWNFYEWAEQSSNETDITRKPTDPYDRHYDLILNAMYVHSAEIFSHLYQRPIRTDETRSAIYRTFYVPEKGLYRLSTRECCFSVLGNSMALLIGLGDEALAQRLLTDMKLIPITLSMSTFYYDALLRFGSKYHSEIVCNIRKKYQRMLDAGADTFWETEKGWQDFEGAGSLCHGWSAIPAYYLKKLLLHMSIPVNRMKF